MISPYLCCEHGESALFYAALRGNLEVVQYLVEQGADLSIKNIKGLTALDVAKLRKHENA